MGEVDFLSKLFDGKSKLNSDFGLYETSRAVPARHGRLASARNVGAHRFGRADAHGRAVH